MVSVLPMYAFLLLASLTEVMKIFMRRPFVSKSTTTSVSKQLTRTRITEEQTECFLIKGHMNSKLHTAHAVPHTQVPGSDCHCLETREDSDLARAHHRDALSLVHLQGVQPYSDLGSSIIIIQGTQRNGNLRIKYFLKDVPTNFNMFILLRFRSMHAPALGSIALLGSDDACV